MPSRSEEIKPGVMRLRPGAPIEIVDSPAILAGAGLQGLPGANEIGRTLKAYLLAARDLLSTKYKDLRELAPSHMSEACRPLVFIFPDGILVRYERTANPDFKVLIGSITGASRDDGTVLLPSLENMAPTLSESFLHCPANPSTYDPNNQTVTLTFLAMSSAAGGAAREIGKTQIYAVAPLPSSIDASELPKSRPMPIVSIRNQFDILMEIGVPGNQLGPEHRFLMRNQIRLPVGWEAIDLFPPFEPDKWAPDLAETWAESDLLAAVLQRNMREQQFHAIDPSAGTRKRIAKLISDCEGLLNGNEEPLHQFIKANPSLLSPTHYRMWSKLSLGARDTDFVFQEPSGEYLLVELEKPSHLLFRSDGQQRQELTHAIDQVIDWRRYIEDNLRTVQDELGLKGISSNPSCLIVIGRSSSLDESGRRKLIALQNSTPKIRIITYDDMLANAKATAENILGPFFYAGPDTEVYLLPPAE